jgi:nitroreductase
MVMHLDQQPHGRSGELPEMGGHEWRRESDRRQQLSGLLSRHSTGPRWLVAPAPTHDELQLAIACALRAPDHGQLVPWRAVLVTTAQRDALGERFAEFARAVGKRDEEVETERERAHKGPALVAWIAKVIPGIPEVPVHEQWITIGGALTNFLNALHLMGYGAKTLSGRKCLHPAVLDAFCGPDEALVAFVCTGTPTKLGAARVGDDVDAAFSVWKPD